MEESLSALSDSSDTAESIDTDENASQGDEITGGAELEEISEQSISEQEVEIEELEEEAQEKQSLQGQFVANYATQFPIR